MNKTSIYRIFDPKGLKYVGGGGGADEMGEIETNWDALILRESSCFCSGF